MINVLGRRFPLAEMILYPSMVQGAEAPLQLISGIEFFGATGIVDVIIIGRGGGSAEDLWAFNDENLARSIFACPIPVISAVGHESDFTICDFVADQRAPTPSAAAELAVPDAREWMGHFAAVRERIRALTESSIAQNKRYLNQLTASRVMQHPEQVLSHFYLKISTLEQGLEQATEHALREKQQQLARISAKMEALNPLSVLARGYATVSDADGKSITRAAHVQRGDSLQIRFSDGSVLAKVTKGNDDGK
jgi:exodeoxyribonuclease VII large subunit